MRPAARTARDPTVPRQTSRHGRRGSAGAPEVASPPATVRPAHSGPPTDPPRRLPRMAPAPAPEPMVRRNAAGGGVPVPAPPPRHRAQPTRAEPPSSPIKDGPRHADAPGRDDEEGSPVVMRTMGTRHTAEDVEDVAVWLRGLTGCPEVTQTAHASCSNASHGDEPATWFYVEADAEAGVARLRCLSGGHPKDIADSGDRWTFPGVWSCVSCNQSIAEVGLRHSRRGRYGEVAGGRHPLRGVRRRRRPHRHRAGRGRPR